MSKASDAADEQAKEKLDKFMGEESDELRKARIAKLEKEALAQEMLPGELRLRVPDCWIILAPQDDITPMESARLSQLLFYVITNVFSGGTDKRLVAQSIKDLIDLYNLERHFKWLPEEKEEKEQRGGGIIVP